MLPRPKLTWRDPETPEEQADFDNRCDTIARIIVRHVENPLPEYKPGEVNRRSRKPDPE